MSTLSPEALLEQLHWRYAVKKFDSTRKIAPALWEKLEQAVVLSPSSSGIQPYKLVVVTSQEMKNTLKAVSYNQAQVGDASHVVVFCARRTVEPSDVQRLIDRIAEVRGVSFESLEGFKQSMLGHISGKPAADLGVWASRQAYIALGVFLSSAAVLGVDACPMEGISKPDYDRILELEAQGYAAMCIATAGYRDSDDKYAQLKKVRFDVKEMIRHI